MNKGSNLDYGIEVKTDSPVVNDTDRTIGNPLFKQRKVSFNGVVKFPHECTTRELCKQYPRVLILCLREGYPYDRNINNIEILFDTFNKLSKNYVLIEADMKMLYNSMHHDSLIDIDRDVLDMFNHKLLLLAEHELVIPIVNVSENDLRNYISQFSGYFTFADYIKLKTLNDHFCNSNSNEIIRNNTRNVLINMKESEYWTYYHNCLLNLTIKMMHRGFNLSLENRTNDPELKKALEKINKMPEGGGNYLSFIYRKNTYIDAASAIKRNGYKMYTVINTKPSDITQRDINQIFDSLKNQKEMYNLFNMMILSKEYCHLALNNSDLLLKMKDIIVKFIPVYKYIIGYAMIIFYIEESIKKTYINENDRFVFSINTASKLPWFPYNHLEPHTNPYLPLLVSTDIFDAKSNVLGLGSISGFQGGINDLKTYERYMNIFTTGSPNNNLFEGLDWTDLAVTGSMMAACIPKKHPLTILFERKFPNENDLMFRYFNEYYINADIDMMISIDSREGINASYYYCEKAHKVYETIKANVMKFNKNAKDINLVTYKTLVIFVNQDYIKKQIVRPGTKYTLEYIMLHLYDKDVKDLFYPKYIEQKKVEIEQLSKNQKWNDPIYKGLYTIIPVENLTVVICKTEKDRENEVKPVVKKEIPNHLKEFIVEITDEDALITDVPEVEKDDSEKFVGDDNNQLFIWKENLKYKIESKDMLHNIEMFPTKYKPFFATVARFHLPCVRSYYNGTDVFMLPSAISAYMSYMNIDYKYFAGAKDPIEIINKYRMRGYGTYLNDTEKIHMIEYSRNISKWQKLYEINNKNPKSINDVFGALQPVSKLFRPRKYNPELYQDLPPVNENDYDNQLMVRYITNNEILEENYKKLYNYNNVNDLLKYKTITSNGYVEPVKKWVLEYAYDVLHKAGDQLKLPANLPPVPMPPAQNNIQLAGNIQLPAPMPPAPPIQLNNVIQIPQAFPQAHNIIQIAPGVIL